MVAFGITGAIRLLYIASLRQNRIVETPIDYRFADDIWRVQFSAVRADISSGIEDAFHRDDRNTVIAAALESGTRKSILCGMLMLWMDVDDDLHMDSLAPYSLSSASSIERESA